MSKQGYNKSLRMIYYVVFTVIIFVAYSFFYGETDSINTFLKLDNYEILIVLWQIQAVVLSFSFVALNIMQSSFDIRIYGQKISRIESSRIQDNIRISLFLVLIMAFSVICDFGLPVIIVFIVSLCQVAFSFQHVVNLMRKPHMRGEEVERYIYGILDSFLEEQKSKTEIQEEFEDMVNYLFSHTRELIEEGNYIDARANKKVLECIFTKMKFSKHGCNDTYITLNREYKLIKNKIAVAKMNGIHI